MKTKFFVVLIILSLCVVSCDCAAKNYGAKCKENSDCGTDSMICSDAKTCKQKSLFPMFGKEIGGLIFLVTLSMFAVVAGAGGGPLYVPILQLIFGMSSKEAVALSNGLTVFSSCSSLVNNLRKQDPDIPRRSLINYDAILSINPTLVLGSSLGAILSAIMADFVVMVVYVLLIIYAITQAIKKTKDLWTKEKIARQKEANEKHLTELEQIKLSRPKELETQEKPVDPEKPGLELGTDKQEPKNSDGEAYKTKASREEERAPKQVESGPEGKQLSEAESEQKQAILFQEGRNITWPNIISVWGSFIIAGLISFLRGGSGFHGWAGSKTCDSLDWVLFVLLFVVLFTFAFFGSAYVLKKQKTKQVLQFDTATEVNWNKRTIGYGWGFTVIMGACSTLSGIGGGSIMAPFFYSIHLMPRSASATSLFTIFFSKVVVTIINYITGVLPVYYLFFIGGLIFLGGVISNGVGAYVQQKIKRQSFISAIFLGEIGVCLILFIISSIINTKNTYTNGSSIFNFKSYC
jgi:uncharacterized membrane protein YfcA